MIDALLAFALFLPDPFNKQPAVDQMFILKGTKSKEEFDQNLPISAYCRKDFVFLFSNLDCL